MSKCELPWSFWNQRQCSNDDPVMLISLLCCSQLAVNRQHSTLSRFLLDKSARNMHFALKGSWLFHSAVEDRIDRLSEAASKMREEMEMAVVNSKPFSGNAAEPGQLTPSHAFPQKSPDLFLRRK